mgnify:CR=1 FL=1
MSGRAVISSGVEKRDLLIFSFINDLSTALEETKRNHIKI